MKLNRVDVSAYSNNAIRKEDGRFYMAHEVDSKIDALNGRIGLCEILLASRNTKIGELFDENAALKAENERLRKDAERLDWMEAHPRLGEIHVGGEVKDCYLYAVSGALGVPLRAIIDAAMSALPDTKGE